MAKKELTKEAILAQIEAEEANVAQLLQPIAKQKAAINAQERKITREHNERIKQLEQQIERLNSPTPEEGKVVVHLVLGIGSTHIKVYQSSSPIHLKIHYTKYPSGRETYAWYYDGKNIVVYDWYLGQYGRSYRVDTMFARPEHATPDLMEVRSDLNERKCSTRHLIFFLSEDQCAKLIQFLNQTIIVGDMSPLNFTAIAPILQQGYGLDMPHFKLTKRDWQYIIKFLGYNRVDNWAAAWAIGQWKLTPETEQLVAPKSKKGGK